jgi:hypothetical protein
MISDRPEREGFANLVRDLIEARELTADLVARAVEVTKRFWPTEVLTTSSTGRMIPIPSRICSPFVGLHAPVDPRGTRRDHERGLQPRNTGALDFCRPVPQDQVRSS